MTLEIFFTVLTMTVGVVCIALAYLRDITRTVIREQCESGAGAEFWVRSADVLALSGSMMLVLAFGVDATEINWLQSIRMAMLCSFGGLFISVLFVSTSIWRNVPRANERLEPLAQKET